MIHPGADEAGRLYVMVCDRCGLDHRSRLVARTASDLRALVKQDGWRAPTGKKRKSKPDLCPACQTTEEGEPGVTAPAVGPSSPRTPRR